MNKGIHLDLDTWIVPGQIRKANLCRGLGNSYKPAGTEVLVAHNTPPPFQAAQNATTVNTRSSRSCNIRCCNSVILELFSIQLWQTTKLLVWTDGSR